MTEQEKQQLINYITAVNLYDKSKRKYSPTSKEIANFELSIKLNTEKINIYTFINQYQKVLKTFETLVKYRVKTSFKWYGEITNPYIKTNINQYQINRVCLFVGYMTEKLREYIPDLTYSLIISN